MHLFNQIAQKPNIVYVSPNMIDDRIEAIYYKQQYLDADEKIVSFDTGYVFLKDLCSKITDGTHKTPNYTTKGLKFISSKNVSEDGIDFENVKYISKEEHHEISKRCKVEAEDILLTKVGRIGYAKIVPANVPDFSIFVSVALLKLKGNMDNAFIEVFLNSKYGRIQSEKLAKGSNQPDFHLEDIAEIKIPIPSPEIQKYIGDKVRKAEELREEAKRLKKEAEEILNRELNLKDVEFYIKQANNKKYSWTESIEIEDRIDSEFYKPKYRYLSKLNNMSELSYYYKISKKRINKNIDRKIKYIDLSSVNNIIEPSDFNTKELPSRAQFLVKEGNLIISTLKGSNKISIIPEHLNDSVCSTGFIVIASKSHLTTEYLYLVFSNKVFNMQIERYSTGSIMSGVNHDNFNKMLIPVISNKQIIDTITNKIRKHFRLLYYSKQLIQEAKQDVEDLIEGNFDMSKVKANN